MRCKRGSTVLLTLLDGTALSGTVTWSWRWRVIRLVDAATLTPTGPVVATGQLLIPHRSVLMAQEVPHGDDRD